MISVITVNDFGHLSIGNLRDKFREFRHIPAVKIEKVLFFNEWLVGKAAKHI